MTKFNPKNHITNMRGKDYLEVKWRLVWFREDHPDGCINTDVVQHDPVVMKAKVVDAGGRILGVGHGTAKLQGVAKSRPYEGAETAAIGRALAHAGYGTQFTGEDEGENIADSPVEKKAPSKAAKSDNGTPTLNPKFLVDNELAKDVPSAAQILNELHLGGKKATEENMTAIRNFVA